MKVNFSTLSNLSTFTNYQNNYQNSPIQVSKPIQNDIFVKSSNNISFNGVNKNEKVKDILSDMAAIGIIGAPLVLSIAASSYAMRNMDVKDIFLPDGSYLMSIDDLKIETDKITADADDGIFKVEGTPIDIDASKYDYADVANGVFKNYDGSVDIDLANNKYIDFKNGIFVHPESKMSLVRLSDGSLHNMPLPDLNSPNFKGASMSFNYSSREPDTRQEFIDKHNIRPEDQHGSSYESVIPNDNRNLGQKFVDWFKFVPRKYDDTKEYDLFGRELMTIHKKDGSMLKIAIDEKLQPIIDKYDLKENSINELSEFFDAIKLKNYIAEFKPSQEYYNNFIHVESFNEFAKRLCENHTDISEIVTDEAINQIDSPIPTENHDSFLEILKELFIF